MESLLRMIVNGLETGSFYALAALGIIIIFRTSFTTNFAQGMLGTLNAYVAAEFMLRLGVPTIIAFILAVMTALVVGILIDFVIIRPAKKVNALGKQILTLAIIMIIMGLIPILFGTEFKNFNRLIASKYMFNLGPLDIEYNQLLNISIAVIIMLVIFFVLQFTKWGLAVRVTASNEHTARLMGVPTKIVTMIIWSIAAGLSAVAALLLAPRNQLDLTLMNNVQINAFIACVFGGFQTFYGPVIAAFIIGVIANLLQFYVSDIWGEPLLYILILSFIIIRPYGLFGKKFVKKV